MCVPHCRDRNIYASGSQPLVDGDPHNRITHNLATHLLPKYYYNPGFGDPKVSARDPKVGLDPPVENHWSIPHGQYHLHANSSFWILQVQNCSPNFYV